MRKFLLLAVIFMFAASFIYANEIQQPTNAKANPFHGSPFAAPQTRTAPAYDFITAPTSIINTYYDYMPGSYCGHPLQVQTVEGFDGNMYLALSAKETSSSTRRVYLVYINADGTIGQPAFMNPNSINEGFCGIDIDDTTGDPIGAWHCDYDGDGLLDTVCGFDAFHTINSPGMLSVPFIVFDRATYPYPDVDEFIWPYVHIGPSPVDGARRVYIDAANSDSNDPSGNPAENIQFAYADFTTDDLASQDISGLDWHFVNFPLLDQYNGEDALWGRFYQSTAVDNNGTVAIIGTVNADDNIDANGGTDLMAFVNTNYGEGDWTTYRQGGSSASFDDPIMGDGTYLLPDAAGEPIFFDWMVASHPSAVFDSEHNIHFFASQSICMQGTDGESYFPFYTFVKGATFNTEAGTFTVDNLYPQATDENNTYPLIPWDTNNDGTPDEVNDDGSWNTVQGWPVYWYVSDDAFHENLYQITGNKANNWLVAVWGDGLKAKWCDAGDTDYSAYAAVPEQMIALSADNGRHWSDPIVLNSIDTPEFSGMIPEYVYPADLVQDLGNNHGKLNLFFMDDNDYGSSIQGNGASNGGTLMYTSLDIDFTGLPTITSNNDNTVPQAATLSIRNYPNPFNPTTQIAFSVPTASNVNVNIYNVRGELVKTLANSRMEAGSHTLTWNGDSNAGTTVASGVYFAKVQSGSTVATTKMMLLK